MAKRERVVGPWDQMGPVDLDPAVVETIKRVLPFTQTSPERIAALCASVEYLVRSGVRGDMVECGVWKGGSMMAVALTLRRLGRADRELYLFDTFAGKAGLVPTQFDIDITGRSALEARRKKLTRRAGRSASTKGVPRKEVEMALLSTGYDAGRLHFVEGAVEETLPDQAPSEVALLRLDTDWYESTRHELTHLYPRLQNGGVLIIDDYGHYEGAKKAVDEYFEGHQIFLHRIDYTGRIAVKQQDPPNSS
jgi:O-methyltransferase